MINKLVILVIIFPVIDVISHNLKLFGKPTSFCDKFIDAMGCEDLMKSASDWLCIDSDCDKTKCGKINTKITPAIYYGNGYYQKVNCIMEFIYGGFSGNKMIEGQMKELEKVLIDDSNPISETELSYGSRGGFMQQPGIYQTSSFFSFMLGTGVNTFLSSNGCVVISLPNVRRVFPKQTSYAEGESVVLSNNFIYFSNNKLTYCVGEIQNQKNINRKDNNKTKKQIQNGQKMLFYQQNELSKQRQSIIEDRVKSITNMPSIDYINNLVPVEKIINDNDLTNFVEDLSKEIDIKMSETKNNFLKCLKIPLCFITNTKPNKYKQMGRVNVLEAIKDAFKEKNNEDLY